MIPQLMPRGLPIWLALAVMLLGLPSVLPSQPAEIDDINFSGIIEHAGQQIPMGGLLRTDGLAAVRLNYLDQPGYVYRFTRPGAVGAFEFEVQNLQYLGPYTYDNTTGELTLNIDAPTFLIVDGFTVETIRIFTDSTPLTVSGMGSSPQDPIRIDGTVVISTTVYDESFTPETLVSSGVVSLADRVVPTPTPIPTSSPTPTPSPTPSPTPIPANGYNSNFSGTSDGWEEVGLPGIFDVPVFDPIGDAIRLSANGSTSCFGFWKSPPLSVDPDSLYAITWTLRSNTTPDQVPELRLRVAESQNRHSALEVVSSAGDGQLSPGTTPQVYNQSYLTGSFESEITLNLDILSFDPANDANAAIDLLSIEVIKIE